MKRHATLGLYASALTLALLLTGCGGESGEGEAATATQVAAQVNGEEITVHQINFALQRMPNLTPEQTKTAAPEVLKSLVDRELLVQAAIEDKLDRDPQVSKTLEDTRRQILATAYMERVTANVAKPTEAEIRTYFDNNPALFSQRRIYRLQELAIRPPAEKMEALRAKMQQVRNLGELAEWLRAEQIPAQAGQSVKPAEQLPLELLPRLQALNPGQSLTLAGDGQITVLIVADAQSQPIGFEQAKPLIERFLIGNKRRELADAKLKELRLAAQIEYKGEYTHLNPATPAAGEPAAPTPTAPAAPAAPGAAAPAAPGAPAAPAAGDQGLERGLQGLN